MSSQRRHGPVGTPSASTGTVDAYCPVTATAFTRPADNPGRAINRFVAALADVLFVAHAEPGGKTEAFCLDLLGRGKRLYTLDDRSNENLLAMGARPAGEIC